MNLIGIEIILCAALFQAVTGFILLKQHKDEEHWGLGWLALALLAAALVNAISFYAGYQSLQVRPDKPIAFLALEFVLGFGSLAALLTGITLYSGRKLNKPWRFFLLTALATAGSTVVMVSLGLRLFGDLIAALVFALAAAICWFGHKVLPKAGFNWLVALLTVYPVVVVATLLITGDSLQARPVAALTYALIGVLLLAIILSRRNFSMAKALTAVQRSQQQLTIISNNLPDSMIYQIRCGANPGDRHFTYVSRAVTVLHELNPEQVLQDANLIYQQMHPADIARMQQAEAEAITGFHTFRQEYRAILPSGKIKWLLVTSSPKYDESGQLLFDGIETDITAEKLAKQERERLASLVRNSTDAMFILVDGCFVDVNLGAEKMFMLSKADFYHASPADISPPYQADGQNSATLATDKINMAFKSGLIRFEWLHLRSNGQVFDAEVTLNAFSEEQNNIVIAIVRDISERKAREYQIQQLNSTLEQKVAERTQELTTALSELSRTQQELIQSEKLSSLGALVAGVAHELNTPIGNALTLATHVTDSNRIFQEKMSTGVSKLQLEQHLTDIDTSSEVIAKCLFKAAELIGSFKKIAVDQTSYQRRQFNINELLQEVFLTLQPSFKRTPVSLRLGQVAEVNLDSYPGPLSQVLINLINNALIHAFNPDEHGEVVIEALLNAKGMLQLSVIDNGCGIPDSLQQKVFDPFFTTRLGHGGSGLGLHISFNLVNGILGGKISLQSTVDKGSCFQLELPLQAPLEQVA